MEPATVATEPAGRRPAVPGSAADGDLLGVDELLTEEERAIWDRVRAFCDAAVLPIINHYWERGRFPFQLVQGLARSRCGRAGDRLWLSGHQPSGQWPGRGQIALASVGPHLTQLRAASTSPTARGRRRMGARVLVVWDQEMLDQSERRRPGARS
jgi:hypothetical protein